MGKGASCRAPLHFSVQLHTPPCGRKLTLLRAVHVVLAWSKPWSLALPDWKKCKGAYYPVLAIVFSLNNSQVCSHAKSFPASDLGVHTCILVLVHSFSVALLDFIMNLIPFMYLSKVPKCFELTSFLVLLSHTSMFLLSSECEFKIRAIDRSAYILASQLPLLEVYN